MFSNCPLKSETIQNVFNVQSFDWPEMKNSFNMVVKKQIDQIGKICTVHSVEKKNVNE
jgi:hypothetical protein